MLKFHEIMLGMAVTPFFSDCRTRRYVYFRICGWGHVFTWWGQWAKIQHDVIFRRVRKMSAPEAKLLSTIACRLVTSYKHENRSECTIRRGWSEVCTEWPSVREMKTMITMKLHQLPAILVSIRDVFTLFILHGERPRDAGHDVHCR